MKPVAWMVGASLLSWLAVTILAGTDAGVVVLLGMIGPLVVAISTWVLAERTYSRHPERLTPVMVQAFAGKLVFFGAYVAVMLRVLSLPPVPFVVSFTTYFIALHLTEALLLRRLFAGGIHASSPLCGSKQELCTRCYWPHNGLGAPQARPPERSGDRGAPRATAKGVRGGEAPRI
jgi:hypothetical protein